MSLGKLLLNVGTGILAGHVAGRLMGNTEEEKQRFARQGRWLGGFGGSLYYLGTVEHHNTVNYNLYHNGRLVYQGICYEHRIKRRMAEHLADGKVFDSYKYDYPKPRFKAAEMEIRKIQRNRPKYNIQNNS